MRPLLLVLLFRLAAVNGQAPACVAITRQHGLPSNTVYDIFQDSRGFLWVATENGLARFNGAHFSRILNSRVRSLAVSGILEDSGKRIWVHNFFGEILYVENDSLKRLESWEGRYQNGFPTISYSANRFWISTSHQLFQYNHANGKWINLDSAGQHDKLYSHHFATRQGELWMTHSVASGIVVTNETGQKKCFPSSQYGMLPNMQLLFEWQNRVWLFDRHQQKIYDLRTGQEANMHFTGLLKNGVVRDIKNAGDSLLAFMRADGVSLLNRKGEISHLLNGKNISSIATDSEGGFWAGTLNDGLYYFPSLNSISFSRADGYLYRKIFYDSLSHRLFAGNFQGGVDVFLNNGKLEMQIRTPGWREVQSIWVDYAEKRLLVFTDKLYVFSLPGYSLEKVIAVPAVKKIDDVGNSYVLATSGGLLFVNKKTFDKKTLLGVQRISTLTYDDRNHELWVGTQKGVMIIDSQTEKQTSWYAFDTLSVGLSAALYHPPFVILGTQNNGIYLVKDKQVIRHIHTPDGLPTQHITSLAAVNNLLFAGTDQGVMILNITSGKHWFIDETKGLVSPEVYDLTWMNNRLWIAGTGGLQNFRHTVNQQVPKIFIRRIWSTDHSTVESPDGITFPPGTQRVNFEFDVANNLKSRGKTRIFYRIRELEKNRWNETNLFSPTANYLVLPAGKFTLEAYATNEDGVPSQPQLLYFTIQSPFWKKGWFLFSVAIITLVVITAGMYYRFRQINLRNQKRIMEERREQELRIAQLTSLRAQMNPHFIFNTLASIQGKILSGLQQHAVNSIEGFSALLRKVLDLSSRELILLSDEIDFLEKYLAIEQERFGGSLQYRIDVDEVLQQELVRIPSLLTQPFVENALRHGLMHKQGERKLFIRFMLRNHELLIEIEDNGVGRAAALEINRSRGVTHRSFALEAYRRRIDLLNASRKQKIELKITDCINEYGLPSGTMVRLTLPLGYELN